MAIKLKDPRKAVRKPKEALAAPQASDVALHTSEVPAPLPVAYEPSAPAATFEDRLRADFRLFLTLLWRHLLGNDPNPIQLDMAGFLQHGPSRTVIMAFRGFSKSWITGGYALWRLYVNPEEKILVVSGSAVRSVATVNWCLTLINTWPLLAHLRPKPDQRQSSKMFDVGPCLPAQSASFMALGLGSQTAGFRATLIVPDDVETPQNSFTADMRAKNSEFVKEFDSILVPPSPGIEPAIKFLGTPQTSDSLYNELAKRGYTVRIWPALHPTKEEITRYRDKLAPYLVKELERDPGLVGRTTMPTRFTDENFEKRRASIGNSTFTLQFMLDTSMSDRERYPLKINDLMVLSLDPCRGPEVVSWSNDPSRRAKDLKVPGFDGDYFHLAVTPDNVPLLPYSRITASVDTSGRGTDETVVTVIGELYGYLFVLYQWASKAGFETPTLVAIARACIRFKCHRLRLEENFGNGMFTVLMRPILAEEWRLANLVLLAKQREGERRDEHEGGTEIVEFKAGNQTNKERRILKILEPITQQHRLVVATEVVQADYESMMKKDGEDTRHAYSLFYQFAHLTAEKDCLRHDDRLDSLAGAVEDFVDIIGVNPAEQARAGQRDALEEMLEREFGELDDDEYGLPVPRQGGSRAEGLVPQRR